MRKMLFAAILACAATPALAPNALAAVDGQAIYDANCSVCHQAQARGSVGQFPPLYNRIDKIAKTPEGRTYLADVVLNGVHGAITVSGTPYVGVMPSLKSLGDDEIAAVLTYISALGDTKPAPVLSAADIAAERPKVLKAKAVIAERKALDAAHPLP